MICSRKTLLPTIIFILCAVTVAAPFVHLYARKGTAALFQFVAADAFYFIDVANRSAGATGFTFDGVYQTNGFHPLWQWILTWIVRVWKLQGNQEWQLRASVALSLALVATGAGLLANAVLRRTRIAWLAVACVVPGPLYLAMAPVESQYGSIWSFVNGMESGCSLLCLGVFTLLLVSNDRQSTRRSVLASAVLTVMTLSRLDDVFIFVPFLMWVYLTRGCTSPLRRLAPVVAVPFAVISTYIAYNYVKTGFPIPISGIAKGSWTAFVHNAASSLSLLIPRARYGFLVAATWQALGIRIMQLVLPALVGLAWIVSAMRSSDATDARNKSVGVITSDPFCAILSIYILLKATYNLALVPYWNQGHWYYANSLFAANTLIVCMLGKSLYRDSKPRTRLASGVGLAFAVMAALLLGNSFADLKARSGYNLEYYRFWSNRREVRKALEDAYPGHLKLIEFDDGIISYSLGLPSLSGLGLTLDREAHIAKKEGRLLALAAERGYRVFGTLYYAPRGLAQLRGEAFDREVRNLFFLSGQDLLDWDFKLVYWDPKSEAVFVKFSRSSS